MEWFTIPSQCTQPELFHHQRGSASDPCRTTYVRPHACWSEAEPRWCRASHRYSFIKRGLSGVIFGGCERLWPSNRKPRPLDGCPTFAPPAPPAPVCRGACRRAYVGRKRRATRISCHGAPPTSSCAAFIKESRMESANAIEIYRKSGGSPSNLSLYQTAAKDLRRNSPPKEKT